MTKLTDPRKWFGKAVTDVAEHNDKIVVLSADSGNSSGFGEFAKAYPDRYFEFGIMEQGVTGIASGLATTGLIPVFAAIAPFVTSRNFEMFRNDLGYMQQNAKIVGRNGGFTYSDLGATHHSLEDYALQTISEGKDAQGEAIVKIRCGDRVVTGRGLSTDVMEARILAYINGMNKL